MDVPLIQDPLIARLQMAYENSGGKKVTVITHSLGGLVFRTLLQLHPEVAQQYVRRWIAIACPFNGASRLVQALVTGYNFDIPFATPLKFMSDLEVYYFAFFSVDLPL